MKRAFVVIPVAMVIALMASAGQPSHTSAAASSDKDVAAAKALFEANLDAIRRRDRDAYLACYLKSPALVRSGPQGFELGYDVFARNAGSGWPDVFESRDLRLTPVRDGLVYGTYRYRVRYGDLEDSGISERLFVRTDKGWRIAMTSAFSAPPETPPPPIALSGATLLNGTGAPPIANAVVVVRNGRIECAGARGECEIPQGIEVMDVSGLWVTPGLVDAHVHFSQTGWADGRPDALDLRDQFPYEETIQRLRSDPERAYRCFLCSGVTAVFDVGGYPWTTALPSVTRDNTRAPHVAASGPLLSTLDHWLNLGGERQFIHLADEKSAREGVRYLASIGAVAVKVWFITLAGRDPAEQARLLKLIGEEARARSLPLIVHATELEGAKAALRAGAKLLVHSVWDREVDDEFIELARAAGTIYCPTLTVSSGYARMFESARSGAPPAIDDPNGCVDSLTLARVLSTPKVAAGKVAPLTPEREQRDRERERLMAFNLAKVHAAGIPIAMGTDAGNPLTLHGPSVYAEMEAMQAAGMKPLEVLTASTRGGAMAMGMQNAIGTLEAGKIADLLLVEADPSADISHLRKLRAVMRGGVLRSLAELKAASNH